MDADLLNLGRKILVHRVQTYLQKVPDASKVVFRRIGPDTASLSLDEIGIHLYVNPGAKRLLCRAFAFAQEGIKILDSGHVKKDERNLAYVVVDEMNVVYADEKI